MAIILVTCRSIAIEKLPNSPSMTKRGGLEPSTLITAWPVLQNLNRLGSNNAADMVAVEQPIQKYGDGAEIEHITPLRSKRIAQEQVLQNQQTGQIPKPIQSRISLLKAFR